MEYELAKSLTGKPIVKYQCPECWESLISNLNDAGNKEPCPSCHKVYTVPGEKELEDLKKRKAYQNRIKNQEKKAAAEERKAAADERQKQREIAAYEKTRRKQATASPNLINREARVSSAFNAVEKAGNSLAEVLVTLFKIAVFVVGLWMVLDGSRDKTPYDSTVFQQINGTVEGLKSVVFGSALIVCVVISEVSMRIKLACRHLSSILVNMNTLLHEVMENTNVRSSDSDTGPTS